MCIAHSPERTYGRAEEPGPAWDVDSCVDEMRRRGIAWVPYEMDAMEDLIQIWRNMPDIDEIFQDTADGTITGCGAPTPDGNALFVCTKSAISESERWFWAHDEATLARFDALARKANLLSILGEVDGRADDLMLYAASFIVVKGPHLADEETRRHADMAHKRIPLGSSFACVTPLNALPATVGGVEFWPWENPTDSPPQLHKCRPGTFVAIDGRLRHRTEPFDYDRSKEGDSPEAAACCDAYEARGQLRVLVSLTFGSKDKRLARYNHKMLRKQTCHEQALIRQSPQINVDIDSELDTSASETEA